MIANLPGMAYRCRVGERWELELASDGSQVVTGFAPDELLALDDLVVPDDLGPLKNRRIAELAATGRSVAEYRIFNRGSYERWVLDVASAVRDPAGAVVAFDGFMIDVTDRRQVETEIHRARKMEGLGRLAGGIAHDFNNLLSVILSCADLARNEVAEESQIAADLGEIITAARRAAELTHQLLAFARRQVLQPRVVDVNELVITMDRILRRVLGEDIELSTLPSAGLWPIEADVSQLEQVMLDLIINARDAMPRGGKLTITTDNVVLVGDTPGVPGVTGPFILIEVADTGGGMTDASTKLGLATSHGIVVQAGGHIAVDSVVGRGTTFRIFLPRAAVRTATARRSRPRTSAPPTLGGGETILLVEDHYQVRDSMLRALHAAGYHVIEASRGDDALAAARAMPTIDLLLTDVVIPGIRGPDLAHRLRAERPNLRVLFASGYADDFDLDDDVSGFLPKPFTPGELCRKVREILDRE